MKRLVSLLLAAIMMLSLAACGNQKAEKYCSHCGNGMAKDASFCAECGTAVNGTTEESKTTSTTTKKATQKKSTTTTTRAKPTTTAHKHSYTKKVIAASCTEKGYSIHSCSCGQSYKDNYTDPKHKYENYICTSCGTVDKTHAYEYLMWWAKKNGEVYGASTFCDEWEGNVRYSLTYSAEDDYIYLYASEEVEGIQVTCYLTLDTYYYSVEAVDYCELNGYIKPSQHTSSTPISYEKYTGQNDVKYTWIEGSRQCINDLLSWFVTYLDKNNVGVTVADLGFKVYK